MRMLEMLSEPVMGVMDRREAGLPTFLKPPCVYQTFVRQWWLAAVTASPVERWCTADLVLLRELVNLRATLSGASGHVVDGNGRATQDARYLPTLKTYLALLRVMGLRPIDRERRRLKSRDTPDCLSPPSYYG